MITEDTLPLTPKNLITQLNLQNFPLEQPKKKIIEINITDSNISFGRRMNFEHDFGTV